MPWACAIKSSCVILITILKAVGYLLYRLISLRYIILTYLEYNDHISIYFYVDNNNCTCYLRSTKILCVDGTFNDVYFDGLYYLHNVLMSGYFFFVISRMFILRTIAIVNGRKLWVRIGIYITSSSFNLINNELNKNDNICCLGIS